MGVSKRKRILFAAYGASHVNMLVPVMRKLARRGDIEQRILALTTARAVAEKEGFDCIGYADLLSQADGEARHHGERLAAGLDHSLIPPEESIAYLGLSYAELEVDHGPEEAARLFEQEGRQCFLPVRTMERLLARERPDLVVTTNSPRSEQALVLASGRRGVPAFPLGDLFLEPEWRWMSGPGYGVRVGVLGEWVKRLLIEKGRPANEIVVVGNPALDHLTTPEAVESGRALRRRLGWEDRRVIAWALPFVRAGDTRIAPVQDKLQVLRGMSRKDPDLRFIVRAHPNQKPEFGDLPDTFHESPRTDPVHAVIHAADVVLTEFSMVGFEAAMADKPLVTIGSHGTVPYGELGLSLEIARVDQLESALLETMRRRPSPRMDILGAPPLGTATDRVIAEIDDLLERYRRASQGG